MEEKGTVLLQDPAEELEVVIGDLETELSAEDLEASATSCTRAAFCI